ncbi:MAG: ABZJ_00895 family protein [Microcoleaceae cyanobacterium]
MKMWNKPYFLVIVDFGLCFGINICLLILGAAFNIDTPNMGFALSMMSAYMIGSVYASKYKKPMPQKLKIRTLIYYNCIIIFLLNFSILALRISVDLSKEVVEGNFISAYLIANGVAFLVLSLLSLVKYWMFGQGSKRYLKKLQKS